MVQNKDAAHDTTTPEPVCFQKLQRDMAELQNALHQQHLAHQDQLMVLQKQNQMLEDDMVSLMESIEKHRQAAQLQVLALTEQNMQHKSYMIRLEQRQQTASHIGQDTRPIDGKQAAAATRGATSASKQRQCCGRGNATRALRDASSNGSPCEATK